MARYIDANKLLEKLKKQYGEDWQCTVNLSDIGMTIYYAPTADVEEVKHGEWIQGIPYRCSNCGKPAPEEKNTSEEYSCWLSDYCPHCGCKNGWR